LEARYVGGAPGFARPTCGAAGAIRAGAGPLSRCPALSGRSRSRAATRRAASWGWRGPRPERVASSPGSSGMPSPIQHSTLAGLPIPVSDRSLKSRRWRDWPRGSWRKWQLTRPGDSQGADTVVGTGGRLPHLAQLPWTASAVILPSLRSLVRRSARAAGGSSSDNPLLPSCPLAGPSSRATPLAASPPDRCSPACADDALPLTHRAR
jgi:hypothetical protein